MEIVHAHVAGLDVHKAAIRPVPRPERKRRPGANRRLRKGAPWVKTMLVQCFLECQSLPTPLDRGANQAPGRPSLPASAIRPSCNRSLIAENLTFGSQEPSEEAIHGRHGCLRVDCFALGSQ
jgi:hypothetical protein